MGIDAAFTTALSEVCALLCLQCGLLFRTSSDVVRVLPADLVSGHKHVIVDVLVTYVWTVLYMILGAFDVLHNRIPLNALLSWTWCGWISFLFISKARRCQRARQPEV